MSNEKERWHEVSNKKVETPFFLEVLQNTILPSDPHKNDFVSTIDNSRSGSSHREVTGRGDTPEEAYKNAVKKI